MLSFVLEITQEINKKQNQHFRSGLWRWKQHVISRSRRFNAFGIDGSKRARNPKNNFLEQD